MQNLAEDVPRTITQVLESTNWRSRKEVIERVFAPDADFWHIIHLCHGRKEILGVYEMWGAYNTKIDVDYHRVVPDRKTQTVVVDLTETCRIWWAIPTWFGVPLRLYIHVIMHTKNTDQGYVFTYQEDHILWLESLLYLNPILTLGFGPTIFRDIIRPNAGKLYANLGNAWYQKVAKSLAPQQDQTGKARMSPGIRNPETDLREAMTIAYAGSPKDRQELGMRLYKEDAEFWHPFCIVRGRENIIGVWQFWCSINSYLRANIRRTVVSQYQDLVLVDIEHQFKPFLWPFFLPPITLWVHAVLTLEPLPGALGGFQIVKHEDHVLWVESLLLRNLGPLSHLYDKVVRRLIGLFFCFIGNMIYNTMAWLSTQVEHQPQAKHILEHIRGLTSA
jgi:hypothetical protein